MKTGTTGTGVVVPPSGSERRGIAAVLAAGVSWGLLGIFVKYGSAAGLTSLQIGFLRVSFAGIMMFLYLLAADRSLFRIRLKDIWMFIGTGVISLTLFSLCYFTVTRLSEVSIAVTLLYTSPIFVMLMSAVFFHEKITGRKILALLMTFTGCIFVAGIFGGGAVLTPLILCLGLASGFFYGLYSIFGKFAVGKYTSQTITFYTFLFSALAFLPFSDPADLAAKLNPVLILVMLLMAFVSTFLPYVFYTYGLSCMDSGKAAIYVTVEPMVGTLTGILLFHEEHGPLKILGIALILGASVLLSLQPPRSYPSA
ncbi:MAG: DMT family transporter [Lachnospiraceae bacterium]|jgi:drug/metabolite transporter, DME family|nr:DMT family transporter [Lachnospiraceae bacterium]MCI1727307.1 DMT family transporter [Lachnospiraceae bacterium]